MMNRLKLFYRKIYYQLWLLKYLKSTDRPNKWRIKEQQDVLKSVFGFKVQDVDKYIKNLDITVKNDKLYLPEIKYFKEKIHEYHVSLRRSK